MNKTQIIAVVLVLAGFIGLAAFGPGGNLDTENNLDGNKIVATVHKSPTCGCCGIYASYMKKEGYAVQVENVQDLSVVKERLGIPFELESCHTTEVGGYVVEGHIPNEVIEKLLSEKPDIKGIGMPGMPSGSPGMPGPKMGDFVIYEITHDGAKGDVFMTL